MDSPASPATGGRRTADVDGHPTASSADEFTVHGKITYANCDVYEGGLKDGKGHGRGKMTFASGAVYDGDWEDGEIHGQGKTWVNGNVYEGGWKKGAPHGDGKGKLTYANGDVWEGELKDGKRHGQGKCEFADGRVYGGLWEDDKMHGRGKLTYASGNEYVGEWRNNKRHGEGTMTYSSGDVYEGQWEDGKKHGQGKYQFANGAVYEGGHKDGEKHGEGKLTYANGDVCEGEWEEGDSPEIIARRVEELEQYCNHRINHRINNELRLEELLEKIQGIPRHCPPLQDSHFFHGACEHPGVTLEIVECLLDAFPDAAQSMDRKGRSLLHRACSNENIDPRIVRVLLDSWPDAVNHRDNGGDPHSLADGSALCLPLHCLCACRGVDETASLAILDLLLAAAPLSATIADRFDVLPIYAASLSGKSHPFCKRLIDAYPASLRVQSGRGYLPIHTACFWGDIETVKYILELDPESVDARDRHGDFPIHCAAGSRRTGTGKADIIRFLLAKDPGCASKIGAIQSLPIQCIQYCLESARLLFDAYPEALQRFDGRNLSDYFARQGPDGEAMAAFLDAQLAYARLAEDTKAMTTPDENGWLPLHRALRKNASLGAIKLLVAGNPSALRVAVNQLAFPLHIACEFSSVDVVQHIAGLSGILLHTLDLERNSPLHYAIRGGNLGVVQCLVERGIPSVSEPDYNGKLPIQLLWESGRVDRNSVEYVDAVWRLLLARPETVMQRSKDALI